MRIPYLCLAVVALLFCVACGSSSGGVPGFIPKGNFTNASLKGQYVYQIQGFDFTNPNNVVPYREAGVFAADGNKNITNATDDFSEGNAINTVSTGTYAISNDGTGLLSFNNALGTITLAVTMVSPSKVYLTEVDPVLTAGGLAELQAPAAIATVPSGTFVFKEHDLNVNTLVSKASVGAFTLAGNIASNGNEDINNGGTFSSLTFLGSFNSPDTTTGRGQGTFTDTSPATSSFNYYIVDANNIRFLASSLGVTGLGRAELQSGTPTLSGSYAFGSDGDTTGSSGSLSGVDMVGRFTATTGSITAGARDSVLNGSPATNVTFTGNYTQAGARALLSLSTAANSNFVVWMVNPGRGLFIVNDPSTVQDGSLDLQQTATFSNSTMNGQFGFVMNGFDLSTGVLVLKDRVGTLQWDGSGNLILNETSNANGSVTQGIILSGKYQVAANGRTAASISNLSNNLVFYLVSGSDAYLLQNDANVQMDGTIGKQ